MNYDKEKFAEFRTLAITDVKDLVVGNTYYSNFYPEKFVLEELLTEQQHRIAWNKECDADVYSAEDISSADNTVPTWFRAQYFLCESHPDYSSLSSLHDNNIGASYNPWLIFEKEEDAKRCSEELKVEIEPLPRDFEDYDSYYYDYEDYED